MRLCVSLSGRVASDESTFPAAESRRAAGDATVRGILWGAPVGPGVFLRFAGAQTLGRSETCDFALPGNEASRCHAELVTRGDQTTITDRESRNGTYVDGARVRQSRLSLGTTVRIGEWVGRVVSLTAAQAERAPWFREVGPGLFGGPALARALADARAAAKSSLPVVLEGETGSGKERVARAIHEWSGRGGPFVAVNCAAFPESLAEAELFGYRKGAFTGAVNSSLGHLRRSSGGTLFLDEIEDLPLAVQAKLLRAIEQHEVVALGQPLPEAVDLRVLSACQGSLTHAVESGRFRGDLHARLDGVTIRIPPLRERAEDVPSLFEHFLRRQAVRFDVHPSLIEALCLYDWPYNVRELEFLARRLGVLRGESGTLLLDDLPPRFTNGNASPSDPDVVHDIVDDRTRRDERDLAKLIRALRDERGNVARAATAAGISRQRAYRLMDASGDVDLDALRKPDD